MRRQNGVLSISASRKRTSRPSRSSATSSAGRSVSCPRRSRCRAIARRSTSRDPMTDPRRGRRLMYMRDLACCANGMAFYSTPSDLVRFALATNPGSVNGELAGGMVMSLMTGRDSGIVIAVTSNMAHANTSSLALRSGTRSRNRRDEASRHPFVAVTDRAVWRRPCRPHHRPARCRSDIGQRPLAAGGPEARFLRTWPVVAR